MEAKHLNAGISLCRHKISEALNGILLLLYSLKPWNIQRGFIIVIKKSTLTVSTWYVDLMYLSFMIGFCPVYVTHNFR
jgi:hypothetical protein